MANGEVQAVKQAGGSMMLLGILEIVVGILALVAPWSMALAIAWIAGAALAVFGAIALWTAFKEKAGFMAILSAGLTLLLGILLLLNPIVGASLLAMLAAIFFLLHGVMQIQIAFEMRPRKGWGWLLFGGILAILLGVLLFMKWPWGGMVAIGVFIGIELIFRGVTILLFGSDLRSAAKASEAKD